jgi:alkanesulfonate monooxygenase SsuD/methylene tetrahydromethanopterin reductase-like flavin-dependent oxidoreductase (luciferase family)
MTFSLGAHIGQQNLAMDDLRATWRRLDGAGLDWLSVWDHLYEAPPAGGTQPHFEAVAALGALAVETTNARIGCLVFYVGYRNPGVLAKAAVTLDHLSGGRFELGLGAGWHQWEAEAFGFGFPSLGTRLDMLDEAATMIRSLLTRERTDFEGEHFRAVNASCLPPPLQEHLPIWVGGVGEKRTLRTAARLADGWNAAYVSPEEFGRLNRVLDHWCEVEGRPPGDIERSVNVLFMMGADSRSASVASEAFDRQWGELAERVRGGALLGTPDQVTERVLEYRAAGADLVNIALRAPWDDEALEAYLTTVVPALRAAAR